MIAKKEKNIIRFIYCFQYITRRILKNFNIISESENIQRDDVKDEPKEATMLLEKPAESKIYYSMYDWLFSTNSSPSAEAKGKLNPIKPGGGRGPVC